MDFFLCFIKKNWYYVVIVFLLLSLIGTTFYFLEFDDKPKEEMNEIVSLVEEEPTEKENSIIYVDLKGAVKSAGVYSVEQGSIINDVIKLAGGFTKKAYTKNINLSKKVKDEMVIYVYTESEYKKMNIEEEQLDECVCNNYVIDNCIEQGSSIIMPNDTSETDTQNKNVETENKREEEKNESNTINSKISLNQASKEELMELNGIGEAKALSIIEYREKNGGFKTVEEIMNVSGIGEAAFAKIKDDITI